MLVLVYIQVKILLLISRRQVHELEENQNRNIYRKPPTFVKENDKHSYIRIWYMWHSNLDDERRYALQEHAFDNSVKGSLM